MKITVFEKPERKIRVVQFGGGVFLRGFFDWMLQKTNDLGLTDADAVIIRSHSKGPDPLAAQSFRYTHLARGSEGVDLTRIDSIAGSINPADDPAAFYALSVNPDLAVAVSNTTESGIRYDPCPAPTETTIPDSYPARLAALLYRRFKAGLPGLLILPCELIAENGPILRSIVERHADDWGYESAFHSYLSESCSFRETLVDRIVSGAPSGQVILPYEDALVNTSEYFHLFVISGEEDPRIPFQAAGLNVRFVSDVTPYRTLKVRILNGAHTSMIPYALCEGVETVGECLKTPAVESHLRGCLSEIVDSLDFDRAEAERYADAVLLRFANPFLHHLCTSIALNSVDKFRVRVLPSILAYEKKTGSLPPHLIFAFGQLFRFYRTGSPRDAEGVIARMKSESIPDLLSDSGLWGEDLSRFADAVERDAGATRFGG